MSNLMYRMCGGTFFTLLSEARKSMPSKSDYYHGVRSYLAERELLWALSRVAILDFDYPSSVDDKRLDDHTNKFKSCQSWGGKYYQLKNKSARSSFKASMKQNCLMHLREMESLVDHFIEIRTDTNKDVYLTKALIDVLDQDKSIPDEQILYAGRDGAITTKRKLLNSKTVYFQPLLLGIWHYVITEIDDYKVGRETYDDWCPQQGNHRREYTKLIGENSKREVDLKYSHVSDEMDVDDKDDVERVEAEDVIVEQSIMDNKNSQDEDNLQKVAEAKHQIFMNITQHGDYNTVIGNVENFTPGRR